MFDSNALDELKKTVELAERLRRRIDQLREGIEVAQLAHSLRFCFWNDGRLDIYIERSEHGQEREEKVCWANDTLGHLRHEIRAAFIDVALRRLKEMENEFAKFDKRAAAAIGVDLAVVDPLSTAIHVPKQLADSQP